MKNKKRWVAIYTKDLYPLPKHSNVVNKDCESREEAIAQLKKWRESEKSSNFWNPQIYDKLNKEYEHISL